MSEFPRWSQHGFLGLVAAGREYALAADVRVEQASHRVEVFAYESADTSLLGNLLPGMASISLLAVDDDSSNDLGETEKQPSEQIAAGVRFRAVGEDREEKAVALQAPRSWWDITVRWGTLFPLRTWDSAKPTQVLIRVASRPSLIIQKLFSTLGPLTGALRFVLYIVGGLLLLVEVASLIFGMNLTRTMTRSVEDLYEGTLKVNSGDFSNRIPIRSNDQLSELAASFNRMTANVEKLIIESKEKERLESELEIAREVQSQLFPKVRPANEAPGASGRLSSGPHGQWRLLRLHSNGTRLDGTGDWRHRRQGNFSGAADGEHPVIAAGTTQRELARSRISGQRQGFLNIRIGSPAEHSAL